MCCRAMARRTAVVSSTSLSSRLLAAGAAAPAAACAALAPAPAHAALGWSSGVSQWQQGPQCFGGVTGYGPNVEDSVAFVNPTQSVTVFDRPAGGVLPGRRETAVGDSVARTQGP
jgi:hypothetical protein